MKITYTKQGDYLIPDIAIRQPRKSLGHYERLRKAFLRQYRPILYNELVLTENLYDHCFEMRKPPETTEGRIVHSFMVQFTQTE